ncbi:hypothetical protein [Mucilaginibacter ginkgonis]|uniref:Uncharacterized protein n=1 Tax=Mucilaginibacter ginkgonis TaxID=2682091 RepID=A0A6I4HZ57_9SPHI|nr:hypothetical protein [Mucilaginibacter ginkgonis]QQL48633.1 hypothetical protein GO620_010610 [Mucilaginibacter ginkgonis]
MLFLIILILTFAGGYIFTWWAGAIIAFVAAFYAGKKPAQAFWSGFGGIAISWIILALLKTIPNDHILADRVTKMMHLPNWIELLLITALIGGLVGGMASLSGFLVRRVIFK